MNKGYCEDCGLLEGGENKSDWICGESGKKVEDMKECPNMAYDDNSAIYFDLYWEDLNLDTQEQIIQTVGNKHDLDNGQVLMTLIFEA